MELGTLGSILKYALNLENILITISKEIISNCNEQNIVDLFQDLIDNHEKIQKRLKRLRRENTTEMILEPIEDFNSDDYLLEEFKIHNYSKENIEQTLKKIETVIRDFYSVASEKVSFVAEVSSFLEILAKKHKENIELI